MHRLVHEVRKRYIIWHSFGNFHHIISGKRNWPICSTASTWEARCLLLITAKPLQLTPLLFSTPGGMEVGAFLCAHSGHPGGGVRFWVSTQVVPWKWRLPGCYPLVESALPPACQGRGSFFFSGTPPRLRLVGAPIFAIYRKKAKELPGN